MRKTGYKLKRRTLDKQATLQAYENRLKSLDLDILKNLENKYVSSYDIYDTYTVDDMEEQLEIRKDTHLDSVVFRLYEVCLTRGVQLRGVTSHRKIYGEYISAIPDPDFDREKDCVFVGQHNAFHLTRAHPVFSIQVVDKRYVLDS